MEPIQFCYWLQGIFEVIEPKELNEKQCEMIKKHLQSVFKAAILIKDPLPSLKSPDLPTLGSAIC